MLVNRFKLVNQVYKSGAERWYEGEYQKTGDQQNVKRYGFTDKGSHRTLGNRTGHKHQRAHRW